MNQEYGQGQKHFVFPQYAAGAWLGGCLQREARLRGGLDGAYGSLVPNAVEREFRPVLER